MATYITTDTDLTSIADAIRTKGGTSTPLTYPNGFISAISEIQTGTDTADANATAADILSGKTAYVKGEKVTGNIVTKGVNDLTASGKTVTVPAGYYASQITKDVDEGYMAGWNAYVDDDSGTLVANVNFSPGYQSTSSVRITYELTTQSAQTIVPTTTDQTIAKNRYLTGAQTIKGDANLVAENIASGVSIFGVQGTHSGGGSSDINDFMEYRDTWTSYENTSVTRIANGTFYSCSILTTVNFPVCSDIGLGAFSGCSRLTSISFPMCTNIGHDAFNACYSLISVNFPVCASVGRGAFRSCSKLTTISFPMCLSIDSYAFNFCYSLTSASFPVCTFINAYAFSACRSLTTAYFPECTAISTGAFDTCYNLTTVNAQKCTSISGYGFARCSSLTSVDFPVCTYISSYTFSNCTRLAAISFPVCSVIGTQAFTNCYSLTSASFPACTVISYSAFSCCYNLKSLYLTGSSYVTLSNSNAFTSTPIAGYTASTGGVLGSIYVPASMLSSYKTSTNWTYFADRFVGV